MAHSTRIIARNAFLLAALAGLVSCSDSNSKSTPSPATPAFEADTSYLDELADEQGLETTDAQAEASQAIDPVDASEPEKQYLDEERTWTKQDGSKSLFGRSRDKAKNLSEKIQGSTDPENGLAITQYDEDYAQAAGFAWNMPEDWQMAVPGTGRFAEMYIRNPLGNASVAFTKETDSISTIKRSLQSTITDTFSGRSSAIVTKKEVMGFPVTILDLAGTYVDPGAKGSSNGSPFYAIHAVVIELPTTKVLIKLWGPSDTVERSKGLFDAMIEQMYEK
jgi:hypothetical protein